VRPRYRHNYGEDYSKRQAVSDLRRAIREGDVDADTPRPAGGSTRCCLEEHLGANGFRTRGIGVCLCSKADQYSRPSGRARSLKRALIQLARHLADENERRDTDADAQRAAEEEIAHS